MGFNVQDGEILYSLHLKNIVQGINWKGVISGCQVTPYSGMTLDVSAGSVLYGTTEYSVSATQVTLSAAPSSPNERIDVIVWDYNNGSPIITVLEGTPSDPSVSPPQAPPISDTQVALAQVRVQGGATAIVAEDITDLRIGIDNLRSWLSSVNDDLFSIKAQLIDLVFLHDTEYFLNKEKLDFAEVWFFDGSETFDTLNNVTVDSANKQLHNKNVIGDFETGWDGWTASGSAARISSGSTFGWASSGTYSAGVKKYIYASSDSGAITLNVDLTDVDYIYFDYNIKADDGYLYFKIDGTTIVTKSSINYAESTGYVFVDVTGYTGTHELRFDFSVSGGWGGSSQWVRSLVDNIALIKTSYLQHNVTQNAVNNVMVILTDTDASKLGNTIRVYVTDGVNTTEITQNKTAVAVNLSKMDVKIEFDKTNIRNANQWFESLDNFAILWREV
ncbi:hypothetical protein [Geoglobus ahangari]